MNEYKKVLVFEDQESYDKCSKKEIGKADLVIAGNSVLKNRYGKPVHDIEIDLFELLSY